MTRVFGEPVDVRAAEGRPDRFVWRGRLYTVRKVLEHWVVTRDWWRGHHPGTEEPGEREFWRVEASPGAEVGVYELRFESASGTWTLSRMWD